MRSRTGCLTCRQRKLKCDEVRPVCGQCNKANRSCQPSTGITFRHQHNASMNAPSTSGDQGVGSLNGFYAYKNTFDDNVQWVDIPQKLIFRTTNNPYETYDNSDEIREDVRNELGGDLDFFKLLFPHKPTRRRQGTTAQEQQQQQESSYTHGLEALSAAALSSGTPRPQKQKASAQSRPRKGSTSARQEAIVTPRKTDADALNEVTSPIDPSLVSTTKAPEANMQGQADENGESRKPTAGRDTDQDVEQKISEVFRSLNQEREPWWPGQDGKVS